MSIPAPSRPLNVAIVGCGYWGPNLVRNFAASRAFAVTHVCDTDLTRAQELGRRHHVPNATASFEDILGDASIDAVAIATPVATHRALAEAALKRGKHVWLEKPLTHLLADAEALVATAKETKRTLFVDHTFLYTPAVRKLREYAYRGELGDALYFDSVRINLGLFQSDTNVLWDLGPHDLSIAQYVLGKRAQAVSAVGVRHVEGSTENLAYVTVKYDEKLMAHFHFNWLSPVKVRRIIVGGTRKMVVFDDLETVEKIKVYDAGIDVTHPASSSTRDLEARRRVLVSYRSGDMFSPKLEQTEALRTAVEEFGSAIREGREPLTSGEAGLDVVRILTAAQESLEGNGAFVTVRN